MSTGPRAEQHVMTQRTEFPKSTYSCHKSRAIEFAWIPYPSNFFLQRTCPPLRPQASSRRVVVVRACSAGCLVDCSSRRSAAETPTRRGSVGLGLWAVPSSARGRAGQAACPPRSRADQYSTCRSHAAAVSVRTCARAHPACLCLSPACGRGRTGTRFPAALTSTGPALESRRSHARGGGRRPPSPRPPACLPFIKAALLCCLLYPVEQRSVQQAGTVCSNSK